MSASVEPPAYSSTLSSRPSLMASSSTRPRVSVKHSFHLTNGKSRPWVTLNVTSKARSADQPPTFVEGDAIVGSVELDSHSMSHIQEVEVFVTGQVVTGSRNGDAYFFLQLRQSLWSCSSSSQPDQSHRHICPFSLTLPHEITLSGKGTPSQRKCRLPPSFVEKLTTISIQYHLGVNLRRGKFRPNDQLRTSLAYIPSLRPEAPSELRQMAYRENISLLGPEADLEGWISLKPFIIRGTIFRSRPVKVKCTLSLATPLCYTRGTVIPCMLTIQSTDSQALDLLSSPNSPVVHLRRVVKVEGSSKPTNSLGRRLDGVQFIESASWRPSVEVDGLSSATRRLDGEIQLAKDLKPSFSIASLAVEYSVAMLPFEATAFVPDDESEMITEIVEIATVLPCGPRPISFIPPNYRKRKSHSTDTTGHFTLHSPGPFIHV